MRRRNGFTIVELLVAMALIFFIMAILSSAFVAATATFRTLKATGDMANKLRSVTTLMQRDLAADHFEGKKRLSSPSFWVNGPPEQGYFRIWQGGSSGLAPEGGDLDGIGSFRSIDHMLAFTIKVRGDQMGDYLTVGSLGGATTPLLQPPLPPTSLSQLVQFGPMEARYQAAGSTYSYQWGDVAWFLQPQIDPNTGIQDSTLSDPATGVAGVPLYTLYRGQRLAVPDNSLVPTQTAPPQSLTSFLQMSCWLAPNPPGPPNLYFNSPMDLTVPSRRFGVDSTNPSGMLYATLSNPASLWPIPPPGGTWMPPAVPPPAYPVAPPRVPYYPTLVQQGGGALSGADIQLTDVVSFDVRVLHSGTVGNSPDPFVTLFDPSFSSFASYNTYYTGMVPHPTNPNFYSAAANPLAPAVFDTWTKVTDAYSDYSQWSVPGQTTTMPLWDGFSSGPTILAIQITIRIWDIKTYQTREVTFVQAM